MPSLSSLKVVEEVEVRATSSGVAETAAKLEDLAQAHDEVARSSTAAGAASETSSRRQLSAAAGLDRVRKAVDDAYRAQERLAVVQDRLDRASGQGLVSMQERDRLLALATQRYGLATQANDNMARSTGLAAYQLGNLRSQLLDVATSLQGGASPLTVLSQQGPQIFEALASNGGAAAGVKALGVSIAGVGAMVTPAIAAVAGLTASVGLGAAAWLTYETRQRAVDSALAGIGRQSGATRQGINEIARSVAQSGDISVASAREIASSFAATGQIGPGVFKDLSIAARDYARVTGQDLPAAAEEFSKAFADPTRGIEVLQARLGSLGDATVQTIRRQQEAGDRLGAQRTLLAALNPELADAEKYTTAFGRAWERLKAAVSNDFDDLGRVIDKVTKGGSTLQERLELAKKVLQSNEGRQQGLFGTLLPGLAEGDVQNARNRVKQLQDEIAAEAQRSADKQAQARGDTIAGIVRSASPDLAFLDELDGKIANLRRSGDEAARRTMDPKVVAESQAALERLEGARRSYLTTEQAARASDDLALRGVQARTVAQQAQIAAEEKLLSLSRQAVTETERNRQAEAARTLVLEQLKRASEDALKAANDNARGAGLLPFQRGQAEIANRLRDDLEKAGSNGGLAALARQRAEADRRALNAEQIGNPLRDAGTRVTEQVSALRVQRDSFLLGAAAAGEMAAKQELINSFARQGVDIMASNAAAVNAYAKRAGEAAAANETLQRTQANIVGGMDEIRSSSRGALTGLFSDIRQGKNPLDALMNSLGQLQDRLFDRLVSKPLTEQLLGFDGKGGGGLLGDGLSKMFGDSSSVAIPAAAGALSTASMNVTAASVTVNGGLGGGLGGIDPLKTGKVDVAPLTTAVRGAGSAVPGAVTVGGAPASPVIGTTLPEVVVPGTQAPFPRLPAVPAVGSDPSQVTRILGKIGGTADADPDIARKLGDSINERILGEKITSAGTAAADALGDTATKVGQSGGSLADTLGSLAGKLGGGGGLPGGGLGSFFGAGDRMGGGLDAGSALSGFETWSANGNVMTSRGPLALNRYANGGIATSPQVSIFGEGSSPEAYVPLPDGRSIPVSMKVAMPPAQAAAGAVGGPITVIDQRSTDTRPAEVRRTANGGTEVLLRDLDRKQAQDAATGRSSAARAARMPYASMRG